MTERQALTEVISDFLAQKKLAQASREAYQSDLQQFLGQVKQINRLSLQAYEVFLEQFKPSVAKRKQSSVNQFLYFLYQKGLVADFHRLEGAWGTPEPTSPLSGLKDWSAVYDLPLAHPMQLAAALMLSLGLLPSELLRLKWSDLDLDFRVIRLGQAGSQRILPLPDELLPLLMTGWGSGYVFSNGDKPYTRQWLHQQLTSYLTQLGFPDDTAKTLRQQFILKEVAAGCSTLDLARKLGLKTTMTLERYYQANGY